MPSPEHLKILIQGVAAWNKWREKNPDISPDLSGANLPLAKLGGANLDGADLRGANLNQAYLGGVTLRLAKLDGTDLREAKLVEADLLMADLREGNLNGADLSGASLSLAHLDGADLRGANLGWADVHEAELRGAKLGGAKLPGANLREAVLTHAVLAGANLNSANLQGADLSGADLRRAILFKSDLRGAALDKADFTEAWFSDTGIGDVDLSTVKGLDRVQHGGPSTVGIDTIYESKGNIPEVFLRGCGVPEEFIVYMRSLVGNPIDFYSCFISYSSKDQGFAQRLHADLQQKGVRCWFAPEDLKIGDKFRTRIDESIRVYDKLMVILSENSIRSPWVEEEVEAALEKERKQPGDGIRDTGYGEGPAALESQRKPSGTVLFPIRLDDDVMETDQAWAASLRRTRHIGDFRAWKEHDPYQKSFERLLRDLKA